MTTNTIGDIYNGAPWVRASDTVNSGRTTGREPQIMGAIAANCGRIADTPVPGETMSASSVLKAAQQLVDALENAKEVVDVVDEFTAEVLPREIEEIVKEHSVGAAASGVAAGWIPGFGGLAAAGISAGFIWTMYGRINAKIRLPFTENVIKSLASGVATNLASYMVGGFVISTIFSLVPGIGSVGASVIVGGTCYALTIASGIVYMKVLTKLFLNGTDPTTLDTEALKRETKTVIETEDIKKVLRDAKKEYRPKK